MNPATKHAEKEIVMKKLKPTAQEIEDCGGVIGYPTPGRYVLMRDGDKILGGEIERRDEFPSQKAALPKYYPEHATRMVAVLDEEGTFTETDDAF